MLPTPAASASDDPVMPLLIMLAPMLTWARLPGQWPMSESANAMILRVSPPEFMMTAANTKNGTAVRTKFSDPTTVRWANPTSDRSLNTKKRIVDAINAKAMGTPSRIRTARTPKEISSTF